MFFSVAGGLDGVLCGAAFALEYFLRLIFGGFREWSDSVLNSWKLVIVLVFGE